MNTAQFVDSLQEKFGGSKTEIRAMLAEIMDKIVSTVSTGEHVQIGNNHFKLVTRKPYTARNPQTGEPVEVGERRYVMFRKRV